MEASEKYLPYIIKEYSYWILFLDPAKQLPYVGRCYAWWKDRTPKEGEGMPPWAVPTDALLEFWQTITLDVTHACAALGYETIPFSKNFLLNIPYLANEGDVHKHHMHKHLVPRSAKKFMVNGLCGVPVEPVNWKRNYASPEGGERPLSPESTQIVKQIMANAIAHQYNKTSPGG